MGESDATAEQARTGPTRQVPFWLAVGISVTLSWPLVFYTGRFVIPLWVVFIVWAQYFTFGAKPAALRVIYPNFIYGCVATALIVMLSVWAQSLELIADPKTNAVVSTAVTFLIGICLLVKSIDFNWPFANQGLPLFSGVAMILGVFFTGSYWQLGDMNTYVAVLVALATTVAAGLLGGIIGWFNVTITFPRQESAQEETIGAGPGG